MSALASPWLPRARLDDAVRRLAPAAVLSDGPAPSVDVRMLSAASARVALEDGPPDPGPAPVRRDDPAYLLLTSGSTGPPKWALHRFGDIQACLATYGRRVLRLRPDDVTWSVAALPTSYGLGRAGWVTVPTIGRHAPDEGVLEDWIEESFRTVARKKEIAQLDARPR